MSLSKVESGSNSVENLNQMQQKETESENTTLLKKIQNTVSSIFSILKSIEPPRISPLIGRVMVVIGSAILCALSILSLVTGRTSRVEKQYTDLKKHCCEVGETFARDLSKNSEAKNKWQEYITIHDKNSDSLQNILALLAASSPVI